MEDRYLYVVESKSDLTADGGFDMDEEQYSRIHCPECGSIRAEWKPRPIEVALEDIESPMITCNLRGARLTKIFDRHFIDVLRPYFTCQVVGHCHNDTGQDLTYVTCYRTNEIFIRGGKGEEYWVCPVCGSPSRDRLKRPDNVLSRDLDESLVFQDTYHHFHLRKALVDRIDWKRFPDAKLDKVRIVDRPLDGKRLPGDPDWDAM